MFVVIGIAVGFVSAMPLGPIQRHGHFRPLARAARRKPARGPDRVPRATAAYALLAIVAASGLNALFTRLGPWLQMGGGFLLAGISAGFFIKAARLSAASIDPGGGSKTASPSF